jgi:hypothetical protein
MKGLQAQDLCLASRTEADMKQINAGPRIEKSSAL